jgi:hypothetical protein
MRPDIVKMEVIVGEKSYCVDQVPHMSHGLPHFGASSIVEPHISLPITDQIVPAVPREFVN